MAQSAAHDLTDKQDRTADVLSTTKVAFGDMMLRDCTLKGLTNCGYETCSPIQTRAIPLGRSGLDLLVQAKSGTGKTLVFAVVIMEAFKRTVQSPQSLVLAPTREIAVQIELVIHDLTKGFNGFKVASFIGGLDITEDRRKMQGCSAIVGTPGRILHLMKNNVLNVTNIRLFVLDEADKLMTESFRNDVLAIGHRLKQNTQTLALSATFEGGLDRQLAKTMQNPIGVTPKREVPILLGVKQFGHMVPAPVEPLASGKMNSMQEMFAKVNELNKIFERVPFKQCLIFLNSNQRAESYCNYLSQSGWPTDVMMSRLDQSQRLYTFKRFKNFESRILVCTDLMARGVDSENVNLVINLDVPPSSTTYLHRIGRAGRFGTYGMSITLMTDDDELHRMRELLGTLGGSKTYVLKFPTSVATNNDVDIWEYETNDVREKLFGVEDDASARVEQEGMRNIRRKQRDEKKREKRANAKSAMLDCAGEAGEVAEVQEAMAIQLNNGESLGILEQSEKQTKSNVEENTQLLLDQVPDDVVPPFVGPEAVTSSTSGEDVHEKSPATPELEPFDERREWDVLMSKLTSNVNSCQLNNGESLGILEQSEKQPMSIVEENTQLLAAAQWMVDGAAKQAGFGLNLPSDLFGVNNSLGISFGQADLVSEDRAQPNVDEGTLNSTSVPEIVESEDVTTFEQQIAAETKVFDIPHGSPVNTNPFAKHIQDQTNDADSNAEALSFFQTTPDAEVDDHHPTAENFDRILDMLGDLTGQTQPTPVDILDVNLMDMYRERSSDQSTVIAFDAHLFGKGAAEFEKTSPRTALTATAAEFVPSSRLVSSSSGEQADSEVIADEPNAGDDAFEEQPPLHDTLKGSVLDPDYRYVGPASDQSTIDSNEAEKGSDDDKESDHVSGDISPTIDQQPIEAKETFQPFSQPSNIKGCPWTAVAPKPLPAVLATFDNLSVDHEFDDDDTYNDEFERASDDEVDEESSENEEQGEYDEACSSVADTSLGYFSAGLNPVRVQRNHANVGAAQMRWNAAYRRQLQQIQSYVQYSKDFNRL